MVMIKRLTLLFLLIPTLAFAQPFGGGGPFPDNLTVRDDGTVVDGTGKIVDFRDNISVTFDSVTSTYHVAGSAGGSVSDAVYGITWDGITTVAPSKNAVYDKIQTLGGGHDAVTLAGTPNYLTLSGQIITLTKLDISDDTNATGGTGIDINTNDFVVDATELEAITFGAGGNASNIWTFNLSGATDPTITFSNAAVAIGGTLTATNLSNTNTGDNTVATSGDSATSFFPSGTLEEGLLPDSATVTGWALGASTATTLNKLTLTQPATGSTLTILDGKTLTVNNTATIGTLTDTKFCTYTAAGTSIDCTSAGGSGAPTDADYLVGTANAGLSAEIIVGTAPGGELGNTWASPTIDDGVTVADWVITGSLAVPQGTNPTVDAVGEVAVDTSATVGSGIRFYGDAAYTLPGYYSKSLVITGTTTASDSPFWRTPWAITIRAVHCLIVGGTNVVGQLDEYDTNGANPAVVDSADITCTTTNANDDGTLSNPSIDAGDYLGWHTTSVSGTNTRTIITWEFTVDGVL